LAGGVTILPFCGPLLQDTVPMQLAPAMKKARTTTTTLKATYDGMMSNLRVPVLLPSQRAFQKVADMRQHQALGANPIMNLMMGLSLEKLNEIEKEFVERPKQDADRRLVTLTDFLCGDLGTDLRKGVTELEETDELLKAAFAHHFAHHYFETTSNKFNFEKFRKDVALAGNQVAYLSGQAAGQAAARAAEMPVD
jgi:hypothetical protein